MASCLEVEQLGAPLTFHARTLRCVFLNDDQSLRRVRPAAHDLSCLWDFARPALRARVCARPLVNRRGGACVCRQGHGDR